MTYLNLISGEKAFYSGLELANNQSGAFYLYKDSISDKTAPLKLAVQVKSAIQKSIVNISNQLTDFNLDLFANNFVLQCPDEYLVNNMTGILSHVMQNKKVGSSRLIDLFFDYYVPMLNMNLQTIGYNDINALKVSMANGTINAVSFIQGLYDGLKFFQNNGKNILLKTQYEELPLDVVVDFEFESHEHKILSKRILPNISDSQVTNKLDNIYINIVAHIHNPDGSFVKANNIINKLEQTMSAGLDYTKNKGSNKKSSNRGLVILRVGKDIFEHCRISDLRVNVSESYDDLRLTARLYYDVAEDIVYNRQNVFNSIVSLL